MVMVYVPASAYVYSNLSPVASVVPFGHYDSRCTVTPTYRDSRGSIAGVGEGNAESQIATFHLHGEPHCINWNRGDECVRCGIRFLFSGSERCRSPRSCSRWAFFQDCLICGAHCEIGDGGQEYFDVRVVLVMMPVPKLIPSVSLTAFVPSNMRAVIAVHPSKALFTLCISACRNISVIEVQFLKALWPILFILLEILARVAGATSAGIGSFWMTVVSAVQPSKALSPMASRGVGQYDFLYLCAACKACHVGYAADAGQVDGGDILSLGFFQESGQGGDVVGVYRARHGQFGLSLGRGLYCSKAFSKLPRRSGWQADGFAER